MNYQRGMKHIAVDPICGQNPSKADVWVTARPGTDLAYCMCLIRHLIKTETYDADFMKEWTNAAFLVNPQTGSLLTEADAIEGGSKDRYYIWDANSDGPAFWDAAEIQWQGGVSGKAHFDSCIQRFNDGKGSKDLSPARLPESANPALLGTYPFTLKDGTVVQAQPAFQQLADNVEEWDLEQTAEVTGAPIERLEASCELMATVRPVQICQGIQYMATNISQYLLAITCLKTMTGSIDVPGGNEFVQIYPVEPMCFPGEWDVSYNEGLSIEQKQKRLGYYEHPLACGAFYDEEWVKWHPMRPENADALLNIPDVGTVLKAVETGEPYEVHGMIAISSNWLMHDPSTARWLNVIMDEEKIQLHVVTDMVMTPTAELADYVLPAATWMERNYLEFGTTGAAPSKNFFRKAIEPIDEAKQDYYFGALLARKLEKLDPKYNSPDSLLNPETSMFFAGEHGRLWENEDIDAERDRLCRRFLGKSLEQCFDERKVFAPNYEPGTTNYRHLVAGRIPTDTGKINVFSTMHQKYGFSPLPVYSEPAESPVSRPDLAQDYPLVLSTGKRQNGFFHSEFRQLPYSRQMSPVPEVMMNTDTAAGLGLKPGDWVWVEAPPTSGREKLHRIMGMLSTRFVMRPGQATYSQHAWWRPEKPATEDFHGALEWNAEVLLECENRCPETGTPGLRSQLCKVYKCSQSDIDKYKPLITREQLEAFQAKPEEAR
jgi:anaerobic selenocysteine-containing dehydrogenase